MVHRIFNAQDNIWEGKHTGIQAYIATHGQRMSNTDRRYTNITRKHGKQTTHICTSNRQHTYSKHTDGRYIDNTYARTAHRPYTEVRFTYNTLTVAYKQHIRRRLKHIKPMDGWHTKHYRAGCTELTANSQTQRNCTQLTHVKESTQAHIDWRYVNITRTHGKLTTHICTAHGRTIHRQHTYALMAHRPYTDVRLTYNTLTDGTQTTHETTANTHKTHGLMAHKILTDRPHRTDTLLNSIKIKKYQSNRSRQ